MRHTLKLESGKTYSLSQIFSGDFAIAIPDLQRDYCWGLDTYDKNGRQQGELVSGFLTSIKTKWEDTENVNELTPMGLIYGYEWPKGTYQLCDGQQRITTFYLLVGELFRHELIADDIKDKLHHILVRHKAGVDNAMNPALLYSIRETTLYFLSDLVEQYFLSDNCSLPFNTIQDREKAHSVLKYNGRPSWYFLEYDNDPTIQSMLGAVYTIKKFLNDSFNDKTAISSFAKAIANQFTFIYYDMGNRMRGEETFVVLNTTGEPLSSTENLKPLLICGQDGGTEYLLEISSQWEEREDWFWKHRLDKELTSDNLSRDFYTWWLLIHGDKDSVNLIKDYTKLPDSGTVTESIHTFYQSLLAMIEWLSLSSYAQIILTKVSRWTDDVIDCSSEQFILKWLRAPSHREIFLPLLFFHEKYGDVDILAMLRRLCKNYYIGKTTEGKDDTHNMRPYVKFRDIINLIKNSDNSTDVLNAPVWYNYDEKQKEIVFQGHPDELINSELDENLRFDLNVLWSANVNSIEEAKSVISRLIELHNLSKGEPIDGYDELKVISMANQYRVLRFLKGWGHPNGKQSFVNGKYWGTWFTLDRYSDNLSNAYNDVNFIELLKADNIFESLNELVKETIQSFHSSEEIFSHQALSHPRGIMRAWLIGKMLVNENHVNGNLLISTYADYSLCVNKDNRQENLINKDLPPSIGNICLHHVNKNGSWIVDKQYYAYSTNLDTPLYVGITDVDYKIFKDGNVPENIINETTKHVLDLFNKNILQ